MTVLPNQALPTPEAVEKRRAALTFLLAVCWTFVALFVGRWLVRFVPANWMALAQECLNLLLLGGGLLLIGSRYMAHVARPLSSIGLVQRPSQVREFGLGLAIGWGTALGLVWPAVLTLRMHSVLTFDSYHLGQAAVGVLLITVNALVVQLATTGLAFRSLTRAASPTLAALILAGVVFVVTLYSRQGDLPGAVFTSFGSFLFSLAALRTRAVWLPWGLHLGWAFTLSVLFGTSSFFWPVVNGPVQTFLSEPRWLTGYGLGPEASIFAFVVVGVALAVVWRVTRDYAWHYAHDPIVGAGYSVDVPPPAEHTRMEQQAARPALVQIHGIDNTMRPPE